MSRSDKGARRKPYKSYIGKTINGWVVLEELEAGHTPHKELRNGYRKFLVEDPRSGIKLERHLYQIRAKAPRLLSETPGFIDYTGQIINDWKVIRLVNDRLTAHGFEKEPVRWEVESLITGKRREVNCPPRDLAKLVNKQPAPPKTEEERKLYHFWRRARNMCIKSDSPYFVNGGAKGYTWDDKWLDFKAFKEDLLNECGYHPAPKHPRRYRLVPIEGKHFGPGNIQWKKQKSPYRSFSHPLNQ